MAAGTSRSLSSAACARSPLVAPLLGYLRVLQGRAP